MISLTRGRLNQAKRSVDNDLKQSRFGKVASAKRVRKLIGFDATETRRRYGDRGNDPLYQHWYPLMEWRIDREACKQLIADAELEDKKPPPTTAAPTAPWALVGGGLVCLGDDASGQLASSKIATRWSRYGKPLSEAIT